MPWSLDDPVCRECGFDWAVDRVEAVGCVAAAPARYAAALKSTAPAPARDGRWSASMYLWHVVDALRIGRERLLTMVVDPACGFPTWDEDAMAAARGYDMMSVAVGLVSLGSAASDWVTVARSIPADAASVQHHLGRLEATTLIRRNAHEVHHHLMDIIGSHP